MHPIIPFILQDGESLAKLNLFGRLLIAFTFKESIRNRIRIKEAIEQMPDVLKVLLKFISDKRYKLIILK